MSKPTINIEGLVGGLHRTRRQNNSCPAKHVAKIDMRLVPDMTAAEALAALKAHLAKKGFADIDVHMSGGYDPTTTPADAAIIRVAEETYRKQRYRSRHSAASRWLLARLRLHR